MAKAKYLGVYATMQIPGIRNPSAATQRKRYWFVWDDGWGRYRAQLLDAAYQPLDEPRVVDANEFKTLFVHQPHILVTPVQHIEISPPPGMEGLDETAQGPYDLPPRTAGRESHAEKLVLDEKAAELDRELRAEFALALTRLKRGDKDKSIKTFEDLLKIRDGIVPAHKHMFTDFAMDLRKSQLLDLARQHYTRALELAPEDGNAHFNMARIHYETGEFQKALDMLETALALNPDFEYAMQFYAFIRRKVPSLNKPAEKRQPGKAAPVSAFKMNI